MIAQAAHVLIDLRAAGCDHAAVPVCAEHLGGVETEAACRSDAAGYPATGPRTKRLRTVLDHCKPVLHGDLHDRIHVGRAAKYVHRQDGAGFGSDAPADAGRIQIETVRQYVREYRRGPDHVNRLGGRKKGEWRRDHLVSGADPHGPQRKHERIRPVCHRNGVLDAHVVGEFTLEGGYLRPQDEAATQSGGPHRLQPLAFELPELGGKIQKRDRGYVFWHDAIFSLTMSATRSASRPVRPPTRGGWPVRIERMNSASSASSG